jgi:hypothetical protein
MSRKPHQLGSLPIARTHIGKERLAAELIIVGLLLESVFEEFYQVSDYVQSIKHWSLDGGHCVLTSAKMAKGVHERIYSSIVYWFCCQHFFTKYYSFLKFLGTRKSKSFQRLKMHENWHGVFRVQVP